MIRKTSPIITLTTLICISIVGIIVSIFIILKESNSYGKEVPYPIPPAPPIPKPYISKIEIEELS